MEYAYFPKGWNLSFTYWKSSSVCCICLQLVSGYPTISALAEQKCFEAISWNVNNAARAASSLHSSRSTVRGVGGWWVDVLREYRTCFNGQALGTFSPREATMATAQSLSADALEPVGSYKPIPNVPPAFPPLPSRPACRNMLPSQTLTDEKQIRRCQPHYLTTSQAANDSGNLTS